MEKLLEFKRTKYLERTLINLILQNRRELTIWKISEKGDPNGKKREKHKKNCSDHLNVENWTICAVYFTITIKSIHFVAGKLIPVSR